MRRNVFFNYETKINVVSTEIEEFKINPHERLNLSCHMKSKFILYSDGWIFHWIFKSFGLYFM